jgi:hypothetical protein
VFICTQIRQIFKDQQFQAVLGAKEKATWQSFKRRRMVWEILKLQIWWIRMNKWGAMCR